MSSSLAKQHAEDRRRPVVRQIGPRACAYVAIRAHDAEAPAEVVARLALEAAA